MAFRPRCWFFDQDTGEPLPPRFGCPVQGCPFVHPDSPRWKSARKTDRLYNSTNLSMKQGDASQRRSNDRSSYERGTASPKGSSARRNESRSSDGSSKPAWGAESSRKSGANTIPLASVNWSDPNKPAGWGESSRSGRIMSTSIPSGKNEPVKKQSSGDVEPSGDQSNGWGESLAGWGKPSAPNTGWEATPPPPSLLPPLLPPPPPPIPPHLPATEAYPPPTSLQPEVALRLMPGSDQEKVTELDVRTSRDKRKHYWNRLTLLTEAILLRNEYTQVARTLEARRKMQNTIRYTHVSENVQSKLNVFAQEYEDKGKELKAQVDSILTKLVDADILANSTSDEEALAMDQASLRHLQTRFNQLEGMFHKLTLEVNLWSSQPREQLDGHLSSGQKRSHDSASEGHAESNSELLKRLERLEVHLSDIDNQNTQQTENVVEVVDARIDLKLSKLRLGGPVPEDGEVVDTTPEGRYSELGMSEVGNDLQEQVAKLSRDHDEFVEETANLITKHAETAADIRRLQEENVALKQALSGLMLQCQTSLRNAQDIADRSERQVRALVEAVKVIREQSSQPPPPLDIYSLDQVRKRILQDVLSSVNASLLIFREQSEEAWRSSREETLKQIAAKFGPTMDLVNIIHGYFSRSWEIEGGPPST